MMSLSHFNDLIILTLPRRSDLEKGWYGISLNLGGMELGPHPAGLSWMVGVVNRAGSDMAKVKNR